MGKGHYPGGSSKVLIGSAGTYWETGWDAKTIRELEDCFDRWDKRDNLRPNPDLQKLKRQRKEFTYFVGACAHAFLEETLSKTFPPSPSFLRKEIKKAGGNPDWLRSDRLLLLLLTQMARSLATKK